MPRLYDLSQAREVAEEVVSWLKPACTRLQIVGSVRRERTRVHDVDLLAFPRLEEASQRDLFGKAEKVKPLDELLPRLVLEERLHVRSGGDKYKSLVHARTGIPVDLYLASTMTAWWVLTVIRTGSADFNKRLCSIAKRNGMTIHADGRGIERKKGELVELHNERGFFHAIGTSWVNPKERG